METILSNGVRVISNPGTEPVADSDLLLAEVAMHYLVDDLEGDASFERAQPLDYDGVYGNGRYAFILDYRGQRWEVQMPGLPIAELRYLGLPNQRVSNFPRLYLNGSSSWWKFALSLLDDQEYQSDFKA